MRSSSTAIFTDPHPYQMAIRGAQVEVLVTAKGDFRAELTKIDLARLWMQRSHESLDRVSTAVVPAERSVVFFPAGAEQAPIQHSGTDLSPGEIVVCRLGATHHHRTSGPCHWASMSLTPRDLADAGRRLAGRDLIAPSVTHRVRPTPPLMSRLWDLHAAAGHLARTAPNVLASALCIAAEHAEQRRLDRAHDASHDIRHRYSAPVSHLARAHPRAFTLLPNRETYYVGTPCGGTHREPASRAATRDQSGQPIDTS